MRFLTILLLVCSLSTSVSYAQGNNTDSEIMDTATAKANKDSPFSRASDKQIEQTQRYYKKCKSDKNLSKRKDCKCAATSYLETMLKLGKNATVDQILAANINSCLKDDKSKIENLEKIDLSDVTQKQIDEAEAAQEWCSSRPAISAEHDCECVAAKFLEIRINEGPILGKDVIMGRILIPALCKNIVESTGTAYSACMSSSDTPLNKNIEPKKYCECYARKWSEYYENHRGELGPKRKGSYQFSSRMYCLRDSSYE